MADEAEKTIVEYFVIKRKYTAPKSKPFYLAIAENESVWTTAIKGKGIAKLADQAMCFKLATQIGLPHTEFVPEAVREEH